MKRIINKFRKWLFNKQYNRLSQLPTACKIIQEQGFLFVTMPDGTKIPHQTELKLSDCIQDETPKATITVIINLEE